MEYIRKFTNVEDAYTAIANALKQDNWQEYFLVNQEGEMLSLSFKEICKRFKHNHINRRFSKPIASRKAFAQTAL